MSGSSYTRNIGAALLAAWATTAAAQLPELPVRGESAPVDLDERYVDASFGFAVQPPAGSITYRQKRVLSVADVELVQFVLAERHWSLDVRLTTTVRPLDAHMIIDGITSSLELLYQDVQQTRGQEARIAAREGVHHAATFTTASGAWLRQQAVVRNKPTEYYSLIFLAPRGDSAAATALFDRIVESFAILRSERDEERLREALERGVQLLDGVRLEEEGLSDKLVEESYLRFILDGQEIGFVQLHEEGVPRGMRSGAFIREWGWLFKPDGSTVHLQHDMYLTDDLAVEEWENRVLTLTPPQSSVRVLLDLEQGLRQESKLITAYLPQPGATELHDKVLEVDRAYASAAWYSLLPRIVDLARPELYAFSSYNADRRGLVLRTVRVVGPVEVQMDGRRVRGVRLEDSEGLIPPINTIDVDERGRILRVTAGPLQMLATSRQYVEQKYQERVRQAQILLRRHPVKEPVPAPREPARAPDVPSLGFQR